MKKKIALLSSVLTIVVCLAIITGSTFALFTDKTEMSITVTSADVEFNASITDVMLYSAKADADGTLVDEYGKKYSYEDRTNEGTFTNGGDAEFDASTGILAITLITPGDKVDFKINAENTSTVRIQYRYVIKLVEGTDTALFEGLTPMTFSIGNDVFSAADGEFTSDWTELAPGVDMPEVVVSVSLPVNANNDYENLETKFAVLVEAVQFNADVD